MGSLQYADTLHFWKLVETVAFKYYKQPTLPFTDFNGYIIFCYLLWLCFCNSAPPVVIMIHCSLQGVPNKAKGAWPVGCQLGGEVLDILTSFKSFAPAPFSKTHLLKLYTWVNVMGWNKMLLKWIERTFHPAPPHQHNTDKTTCNIKLPVVTLWFTFQPWQTAQLYPFNSCAYRITFFHMVLSLFLSLSLPFLWRAFILFVGRGLL